MTKRNLKNPTMATPILTITDVSIKMTHTYINIKTLGISLSIKRRSFMLRGRRLLLMGHHRKLVAIVGGVMFLRQSFKGPKAGKRNWILLKDWN